MFNFESLNKERLFNHDCSEITGVYTNCENMFKQHGSDKIFRVHGFYPNQYSQYGPCFTASLDSTYLNCPPSLNNEISQIRADRTAVAQINRGELGISFYTYKNTIELKSGKKITKDCYSFKFHTIDPEEYDDDNGMFGDTEV